MKWALASIGLLTLIVVFSFAALDQKNVVWTDGVPHCPHCRSEVHDYASFCSTCRQAFDWETWEEPCDACLSELDESWFRSRTKDREAEIAAALEANGVPAEAVQGLLRYVSSIKSGDCGFCGGTGKWLAPGVGESKVGNGDHNPLTAWLRERIGDDCPVCLGSGTCVLCDGDHSVTRARESPARELNAARSRLKLIDPLRDPGSTQATWDVIREFVSRNQGRYEVGLIPAFDEPGEFHTTRARHRLENMRKLVSELP